ADVGKTTFGEADIWARLNDVIFGDERCTQLLRKAANSPVLLDEILPGCHLRTEWIFLDGLCHFTFSLCHYHEKVLRSLLLTLISLTQFSIEMVSQLWYQSLSRAQTRSHSL